MPAAEAPAEGAPFVVLQGTSRPLLPLSSDLDEAIDPSRLTTLTVRTRADSDLAGLETLVQEIYDKPLLERSYLSRQDLAARFGARAGDLEAVRRFAEEPDRNLAVSNVRPAERSLQVTGKLGDLLEAFPAQLRMLDHPSGKYRGRTGDIMIPSAFDGVITGIFGYDTRPKFKAFRRGEAMSHATAGAAAGTPVLDLARRYKFPDTFKGKPLDGGGQCIAIIELGGGFDRKDLEKYFSDFGLPVPRIDVVPVDRADNAPTSDGEPDIEVMLDIEVAGAVAPKATIAVYFAPLKGRGFLDAISAAVHDAELNPSVISISWGLPESLVDPNVAGHFHDVFLEAAALGVTVCVAAGDHGAADFRASHWPADGAHVDHPAAHALVLACGGTQIDEASKQDVVWNDNTPFDPAAPDPLGGGWAGGGGVSTREPPPTYQAGLSLRHVEKGVAPLQRRGVPDIAMNAADYLTRVHGRFEPHSGTSAVAPLMAGLVARLNQAKGRRVGFLNPFLYKNPHLLNDIKQGDNSIKDGARKGLAGYQADAGWDACTGLGTPDGTAILNAL